MPVLDIEGDAKRVWDVTKGGGVALIPIDVAYTVVAQTPEGIDRTYAAKGRSLSKPCGSLANLEIFDAILKVDNRASEAVHAIVGEYDLAMSVIAPFEEDHEFFSNIDPKCIQRSTKNGTMDMLLNAGRFHNELARLSWEQKFPIMGSSANVSLTGSKFRLEDVEQQVRDAADIEIDYGLVKHHNPELISSTIIDVTTFDVHRFGANYEMISDILKRHFGMTLPEKPAAREDRIRGSALGDQPAA